ncbi:MAG: succinate dehydrogenase, cytochrome b556 subunit [Betaproteobacteria bacterium]|nr:succinate dehydrogenase, cytochrome b556 subunit [Betaproteobacteria bacterium]
MNKNRPVHLDLRLIKLPLPGFVSILHRVSGLLLFLALPLFLRMLQNSLFSIETYTQLAAVLRHPLSKLFLISLLWAFLHHFCAGIRYLAIDMHIGVRLAQVRASSKWVLFVSMGLTLLIGAWLW